jgi:hypothetical protein
VIDGDQSSAARPSITPANRKQPNAPAGAVGRFATLVAADGATLFGTAEFVNDFIRAAVKGLEAVVLALAASATAAALRQLSTASPWGWITRQANSRWGRWTDETLIPAPYLVALTRAFA